MIGDNEFSFAFGLVHLDRNNPFLVHRELFFTFPYLLLISIKFMLNRSKRYGMEVFIVSILFQDMLMRN